MYPALSDQLSFTDYISQCRTMITTSRKDLNIDGIDKNKIIEANCPFELMTEQTTKRGALLIHGLYDCPFTMLDIANQLQQCHILCRGILLPGHGTKPEDLLDVKYENWIETVNYGVNSLANEVEDISLIGYSTGATLSIYQALNDKRIKRIILLAPAIGINETLDIFIGWNRLAKAFKSRKKWLSRDDETNYSRYNSTTFNSVHQLIQLTKLVRKTMSNSPIQCPILMVTSREDETISSHMAIDFFINQHHPDSKLLLYTAHVNKLFSDKRIKPRQAASKELRIKHLSHASIMFKPDNFHNGQHGDNPHASHKENKNVIYGAYNAIEVNFFDLLYNLGVIKNRRHTLTYNPDFEFMVNEISKFILSQTPANDTP